MVYLARGGGGQRSGNIASFLCHLFGRRFHRIPKGPGVNRVGFKSALILEEDRKLHTNRRGWELRKGIACRANSMHRGVE